VNEYIDRTEQLDELLLNGEDGALAVKGAQVKIVEHIGDLCDATQVIKGHAIAVDAWCGVGVAKDIADAVGSRPQVPKDAGIGSVVKQEAGDLGTIYHVVTKQKSRDKIYNMDPAEFLRGAKAGITALADTVRSEKLDEIAVSYMCSGSDKLHRLWTMELLYNALKDVPVTIHYYGKYRSKRFSGAGRLFASVQEEDETDEEEEEEASTSNAQPNEKKKVGRPPKKDKKGKKNNK
jgi:hypothetical protein